MIQINEWKKWMLIVGILWILTCVGCPLIITNIFLVISTSICMYVLWKNNSSCKIEVFIICIGFALRLMVCLIDIYGNNLLTIPFSGDDSIHFFNTSVEYYYGDFSRIYTKYPYVLNAIYQVVGLNRFAAQYVNVLCWCFCMVLFQKSCKILELEKGFCLAVVVLYAFSPFNICISSILMRDMMVSLSITITSYCILKWMKSEQYIFLVFGAMATIPVILLHNCVLAMLGVLAIVAVFYSPQKGGFSIEKKGIIVACAMMIPLIIVFIVPPVRTVFLTQVPIANLDILSGINGRIGLLYQYSGSSTYLLNKYATNYWELFVGTFERIFYFLVSPIPGMWRGMSDVIAFCVSSSVYILAAIAIVISFFFKKRDAFRSVLILIIFFVSAIFAWGVSSAGTAMRHREKIVGVTILLIIYCIQQIKNARKDVS